MKTLALNMIVGAGDAQELKRCLDSIDAVNYFDEIVIVVTSEDKAVMETALKYTSNVFTHQWASKDYPKGNFSMVRNRAIRETKSDYIMWLDADDLIKEEDLESFTKFKQILNANDFDFYLTEYVLEGKEVLMRERIFKNDPSLRWHYPVHEHIKIDEEKHTKAIIKNLFVQHAPLKDAKQSLNRNIQILSHEYLLGRCDPHQIYCYARETYQIAIEDKNEKAKDSALCMYQTILLNKSVSEDNLSRIAFTLALEYGDQGLLQNAETYSRISISFSDKYAEPFVIIGDTLSDRGKKEDAIWYYKEALMKNKAGLGIQNIKFYKEIPHERLAIVYSQIGENELSLYHIKQLKKLGFNNLVIDELKGSILKGLLKEVL